MKTLDRYVLLEMLGPFLVGIVGFILVLTVDLLFTMADLIINKGVPVWAVLKLLLYKFPSLLVMTFPVSTLFGTAMALGRLSKDNELAALRTSGVSILRIARPILLLGLAVSLLSFFTNERIVPHANYVSNEIIREIVYKQPLPEVKDNVFFRDQQNRFYYVRHVDMKRKEMQNIMVYELAAERYPRVITADSASFRGRLWALTHGVVHKYDEKGYLNYEAAFERMELNVSEDVLNFSRQKDVMDMDRHELTDLINALGKGGANTRALLTEYYLRFSIPFTCFVFALVGIPFSLSSPRSGQTWGIVVTIVFMFTFYVFASVFRSLGRGGLLPPEAAAFTPQVSFTLIGLAMLWLESRFH
jgi:lipopolysaccharide export system permease protein